MAHVTVANSARFGPPNPVLKLRRIIGTTDVDGKGTNHCITERMVDPFVLFDEVVGPADLKMPFGTHPHCGLVSVTCHLESDGMMYDNVNSKDEHDTYGPAWRGSVFQLFSGRGVVHKEVDNLPDSMKVNVPDHYIRTAKIKHILQIWYNPGVHLPEIMNAKAQYELMQPDVIPKIDLQGGGTARVFLGSFNGATSPGQTWGVPMSIVALKIPSGARVEIPLESRHSASLYTLHGSSSGDATVLDSVYPLQMSQIMVVPAGTCSSFVIENNGRCQGTDGIHDGVQGEMHLMFLAGLPWDRQVYKMLGGDGAMLAGSQDAVRCKMEEYFQDPINFGR